MQRLAFLLFFVVGCSLDDRSESPLVGAWEPIEWTGDRPFITFRADGTFEGYDWKGNFAAEGGQLTLDVVEGNLEYTSSSETFYVDDEVFFFSALLPAGQVDDLVGNWRSRGEYVFRDEVWRFQELLSLRSDGSGEVLGSDSPPAEITWNLLRGGTLELEYADGGKRTLFLRGGRALGNTDPLLRIAE
jgi:hypothetical protein